MPIHAKPEHDPQHKAPEAMPQPVGRDYKPRKLPQHLQAQPTKDLQGGIQFKETPYGKIRIYKVTHGNYPLQIVADTHLNDIYELALLQHPTIVQKAGLTQKGYFDYNALLSVSRQDRDFDYWIEGFAKKWIVYPGDELLVDRLPGMPLPKEEPQKTQDQKKPQGPKYRKATDWENWLKRNVSPDEADRIFDALGNLGAKRHKGLMMLIKKKGLDPEKDKHKIVKVLFDMARDEKRFPGGASNGFHPVYKTFKDRDGKEVGYYNPSKKYPGLFTQDEQVFYYAAETGPEYVSAKELANGTWKKYVE